MRALQGWINASRQLSVPGTRFFLSHSAFSHPFLRVAVIAAAGVIGTASVNAATFWSSDDYDSDAVAPPPPPVQQPRRPKPPRHIGPKVDTRLKEGIKPVGPLVIEISINQQKMRVYDANGLFAESPVSTGVAGHLTPLGVFSVIQKQKWHESNIYSGAPMPFMQRITWSGIAMHAGVLPGHAASHGCIRMPAAFAVKMYGWTRSGARVVITPGELPPPTAFSHPLLALQKSAPVAAADPAAKDATKDVAAAAAKPDSKTEKVAAVVSNTDQPPTPSVGIDFKPPVDGSTANQTRIADASNTVIGSVPAPATASAAAKADTAKADTAKADTAKTDTAKADDKTMSAGPADIMTTESTKTVATQPTTQKTTRSFIDLSQPASSAAPAATADAKKDDARPGDTAPAAAAVAPVPVRRGQIAAFVSRKDGKLYVRQDFAPLFDLPITIAPSDRPLGTHVFTARADKDKPGTFQWSVVSMPVSPRVAELDGADLRGERRRKAAGAIEVKPAPVPDSPSEALDRLAIPADAMTRIADAITTGGSLIVSDLGIANGGETGEGTEFVVPLR